MCLSIFFDIMVKLMIFLVIILSVKVLCRVEPINYYIHPDSKWAWCVIWIMELHVMEGHFLIIVVFDPVFEVSCLCSSCWLINFNLPSHVPVIIRNPRIEHLLVVCQPCPLEFNCISVHSKIDNDFHLLISQIKSFEHVDLKLFCHDSFTLLIEHAFVAHVLESVNCLDQTRPYFNFHIWVRLRFKIFIYCWLFVHR